MMEPEGLIPANEARDKAAIVEQKLITYYLEQDRQIIAKDIKDAINCGEFVIHYPLTDVQYNYIGEMLEEELADSLGYDVYTFRRTISECIMKISWDGE